MEGFLKNEKTQEILSKRGCIRLLNPKKALKNLGMITMTSILKRGFWNKVAHKILRPVAKAMPVLLNSTRLVKVVEKVNERSIRLWNLRRDLLDTKTT